MRVVHSGIMVNQRVCLPTAAQGYRSIKSTRPLSSAIHDMAGVSTFLTL